MKKAGLTEEGEQNGRLSRLISNWSSGRAEPVHQRLLFNASPTRARASAVELLINERREGR